MIKSFLTGKKTTSEIKEEKSNFRGHIDFFENGIVHGWAGDAKNSKAVCLDVYVNDKFVKSFVTTYGREDLVSEGFLENNENGFSEKIDIYKYLKSDNDEPDCLTIKSSDHDYLLSGSGLLISKPDIIYNIDRVDEGGLHGWLYDKSYLNLEIFLDVYVNGIFAETIKVESERLDLLTAGHPKSNCGFYFNQNKYLDPDDFGVIVMYLSKTSFSVFSEPLVIQPIGAKVAALTHVAKVMRVLAQEHNGKKYEWILRDLLPSLIKDFRENKSQANITEYTSTPLSSGSEKPAKVDVVIPVYEGLEETINCIESVINSKNIQKFNLIVVNDCSPNKKLSDKLKVHSEKYKYILIENEENLGFVGTVNKGMNFNEDTDILLLNSDTIVPNGWLDQIGNAAYKEATIGTVTPFSNNATICSYPEFCKDNTLPEADSVETINQDFYNENKGEIIDLPTAHGFCMYIKRAVIKEVGFFDDEKWGKGYGEENDFSLRAEELGWRNVMALDTFVQHLGSVSFAENADHFISKNIQILNNLYPDYAANVSSFIRKDPIRPYRNKVAIAQLKREASKAKKNLRTKGKTILFISLSFGGGTKVATDELASCLEKEDQNVVLLSSPKPGVWKLSSHISNAQIEYHWPGDEEELICDLKDLDVWHIHYHHVIDFVSDIWRLPDMLDVEYDVTIHDYYTVCPRANMVDETQIYCGEPPVSSCNECIQKNGVHSGSLLKLEDFGSDVSKWRSFFNEKLSAARSVICPTGDVADRLNRFLDLDNIVIRNHPESAFFFNLKSIEKDGVINVAVIGAIGKHKGFDVLFDIASNAKKFNLPIKYKVIGYTEDDEAFSHLDNVEILGRYNKGDLPKLISSSQVSVAAILSVCPETYNFVLTESMREGLVPFSLDIGSPARRIKNILGSEFVLPFSSSAEKINYFIMKELPEIIKEKDVSEDILVDQSDYESIISDYYNFGDQ